MNKIAVLIISIIFLAACQQTSKVKQETNKTVVEVNEILSLITIEAIKAQDFSQAQRSITALILSNDSNAWEFINSAIISLPQDMGLEIIEASLQLDSVKSSSSQLFGLAKTFISYQDQDRALELINQSLQLNNENHDARFWRARLLTIMKQYDKAEIDFEYILRKRPKNSEYAEQYASFLQEIKQYEKAQEILAKQKPTPDNLFRRIIFTIQAGNNTSANELFQQLKVIEVDDESENNKYFLIAEAAYFLEHLEESLEYYKKVLGGKHYLDARDMLSMILFESEKYDESKEILHQLQNAEEKYAVKAYRLESQINKIQGNSDAALETLNRSLQILSENPILLYDRAMLHESMNNLDLVEQDLLQIIEKDPKNYEALNALGYSLADHDLKLEEAHEYIKKAIKLAPNNPAIIDSLGWVQYKLGQYEEAEKNFKSAMDENTKDVEMYIHLYKTLIKLEKTQEAQELLLKAIDIFPDNAKIKELKN